MLYTPAALELALRCPLTAPLSSGGEDDKPEIAESTLVRGSTVSADIIARDRVVEALVQNSEGRLSAFEIEETMLR